MESSQVMGMIALIVSVGGIVIGIINHKKVRSSCCGRKMEVSLDIDDTSARVAPKGSPIATPPPQKNEIV